jgi:2-polyprenyl-3-methyl-5-hydroxy-6-metoxy-1,4-benzoquinol methylase
VRTEASPLCPTCGGPAPVRYRARDYNRKVNDFEFSYGECRQCGFVFLIDVPSDLGAYYQSEYYLFPNTREELAQQAHAWETYKVDLVRKYASHGRILDIGAGAGRFVYLAVEAGYQADAVEMDVKCCELIRSAIGSNAFQSLDVVPHGSLYDVITMWHVLEHLKQPWDVVRDALTHLKPGGVLVIAMPNPSSTQFKIFGRYWVHLDAPRHLQLIPNELLVAELSKREHLALLETTTADAGTLHYNRMGWTGSTNNLVKGGERAGSVLARLFRQSDRIGLRGSCYTTVFRSESVAL